MENPIEQELPNEDIKPEVDASKNPNAFWDELTFQGKEFCKLENDGKLMLKQIASYPERVLATITEQTAKPAIQALLDKFKEVEGRVAELKTEFAQNEESFKLKGKLQKLKSYLQNAAALGDYQPIFNFIDEKESEINKVLKANEVLRQGIVDRAQGLKDSEEFKSTTDAFRELVNEWKNAPHVEKEVSDKMWEQIEQASNHFYERKRAHHEGMEKVMMQNLDLKLELCEKAESMSQSEDWKATTEAYKALMEEWKTIGRINTAEKNDELWNRFIGAKNNFFDRKSAHQGQIATEQEANYIAKLKLVEQAEEIKESTNWKETAEQYAKILDEWKALGKVPFEKADEIWNRMQVAKDHFFNAKRAQAEAYKVNLEDNYAQKKSLVDRIETIKNSTDWKTATEEINELLVQWKAIGPIPREYGDDLWEQFISARKHFFKHKDDDREARKNRFIQQTQNRITQSKSFLATLEEELAEDESKMIEFNEILNGTASEDAKDEEIKANLVRLVEQIERKMPSRKAKIEEVKTQIAELEAKLAKD